MFFTDLEFEDKSYQKIMISCKLCNYKSNRKSNFERHMKSMHEECLNPFQCCGQVFLSKAVLKNHSREFHKNGYRCDEQSCNKVFPRKALLRRHQTVHNGIKEFSCQQCNYQTSHKSNLERHCSRVHNLVIENPKPNKQINTSNKKSRSSPAICSSQSSSLSSINSESEWTSSQELLSSQELVSSVELVSSQECQQLMDSPINTTDKSFKKSRTLIEYKPNNFVDNKSAVFGQNIGFQIQSFEDMRITDEEHHKCDQKKVRLCLRPYKCLICWLLFESQLEFVEHQLLTDHMIKDTEQMERLEVFRAAAVLTQIRRSKSSSHLNV